MNNGQILLSIECNFNNRHYFVVNRVFESINFFPIRIWVGKLKRPAIELTVRVAVSNTWAWRCGFMCLNRNKQHMISIRCFGISQYHLCFTFTCFFQFNQFLHFCIRHRPYFLRGIIIAFTFSPEENFTVSFSRFFFQVKKISYSALPGNHTRPGQPAGHSVSTKMFHHVISLCVKLFARKILLFFGHDWQKAMHSLWRQFCKNFYLLKFGFSYRIGCCHGRKIICIPL